MKKYVLIFGALLPSVAADTLQPLGDEFNDAATFSRWQDIDEVEGWVLSTEESADINTSAPGHFRIVPKAMGWYMHLRGVLFFKEVTGDFIATTKLRVFSRHNPANPLEVPNRFYSLTGIFIHEPRPFITQAAPNPYRTDAVWPPASFGSDYVPNTENYIFLSYGTAGNPGTRQFEIKTTRNSNSILYFNSTGINQASNEAWVQLVRVGNTVVCLRKYSEGGEWIVENRYPNPDHPLPAFGNTLQAGITAYTDWQNSEGYFNGGVQGSYHFNYARPSVGQPDLISDTDYFRLQRPHAVLTEAVLQAMATSYNPAGNFTANPPILLSASPAAAPYLGDSANVPLGTVSFSAAQFSGQEGGSITVTVARTGASLNRPLSLSWQATAGTATSGDYTAPGGTLNWAANDPAEKIIVIPATADATVEGAESFLLTLSALDGPATFPASAPIITVPVNITEHPFDIWRAAQFGANANGPGAAPNADADQDGLDTVMEHVFQTNPLTSQDTAVLPGTIQENGRPGIRFTCAANPGVRLEVQQSTAFGAWQAVATRAAGANTWSNVSAGYDVFTGPAANEVRVLAPADAGRLFLRLAAAIE
jgi:hypothetical protein